MIKLKSKRGTGLVEVMITVMLLAAAGLTFSAIFPTAFSATRQADEYKTAAAIGQRKMEQLRVDCLRKFGQVDHAASAASSNCIGD